MRLGASGRGHHAPGKRTPCSVGGRIARTNSRLAPLNPATRTERGSVSRSALPFPRLLRLTEPRSADAGYPEKREGACLRASHRQAVSSPRLQAGGAAGEGLRTVRPFHESPIPFWDTTSHENRPPGRAGCPQPAACGAVRTPRPTYFRGNPGTSNIQPRTAAQVGAYFSVEGSMLDVRCFRWVQGRKARIGSVNSTSEPIFMRSGISEREGNSRKRAGEEGSPDGDSLVSLFPTPSLQGEGVDGSVQMRPGLLRVTLRPCNPASRRASTS